MALRAVPVRPGMDHYSGIRELMKTAFPECEQFPFWLLRLFSFRRHVDFTAFFDGDVFCGAVYTAEYDDMMFILYLAVSGDVRSKGSGSMMLEHIKDKAGGKAIVLDAEYPRADAPNADERLRRMRFYRKNGIEYTGYLFRDGEEEYAVLSSDPCSFNHVEFEKLIRSFTYGIWRTRLIKDDKTI